MFREPVFKSIFGKTMRELAPEEYKEIAQALRSCFQDWRGEYSPASRAFCYKERFFKRISRPTVAQH